MDEYRELLRQHELRDTAPRRTVFEALLTTHAPCAIGEITRMCANIDRTTVYRSIETLLRIGAVQAVPIGWKQQYELTSPFKAHHHHIQCVRCKKVIDVSSPDIEQLVQEVAKSYHFTPEAHTFEITGVCDACAK